MTLALAACPPLFSPQCLFHDGRPQVEVRINEPLWEVFDMKKLMAWCAYANVLAEATEAHQAGCAPLGGGLGQQLERLCRAAAPNVPMQTALKNLRVLELFPSLGRALQGTPLTSRSPREAQPGMDYLSYVSLLNQLMTMAAQLHDDVNQQHNHKYVAHQIALLYQCLNQVRGESKQFKKRIEERFEEIKAVTEQSSVPHLSNSHKKWLRDLTSDIQYLLASFPPSVSAKVAPVTDVLWQTAK